MTKVVILCGGEGTRLKEHTEFIPKPLVRIGGKPILWHVMKIYSHYGYRDFILCLGYKGDMIKQYFLNYETENFDFTLKLKKRAIDFPKKHEVEDWSVSCVDTGEKTLTGGRLKKISHYLDSEDFMVTYGDGVADIDINQLWKFHKSKDKMVTITGVHPVSKYGLIKINKGFEVINFKEKPPLKDLINAGFMVCKREFIDLIKTDCMFEENILPDLSRKKQVAVYKHESFFHPMDTYKDYESLNRIWNEKANWKVW
ncbi:NTP transferase domain-containing protein [Candidatus Woesearchaeota archaeon]|nr:NTP transferase domain-containing protein [Candidatus Woesearchaeota archaeon]